MTAIPLERVGTRFLAQNVNRHLSAFLPKAIVCCAQQALDYYANLGYARRKMTVIPNGFDLDVFQRNASARERIRADLGVRHDEFLVGIVGRLHPMKDHRSFVTAAGLVYRKLTNVKFVLAGEGLDSGNRELQAWVRDAGITNASVCLGLRDDVAELYSALDLSVLSSISGEGFPNVLGEAMACEVPCVATDVGESRLIIGDAGRIVAPSDPTALATAIEELLCLPADARVQLGSSARQRIRARYSIAAVGAMYADLYQNVACGRGA
jgi:glycosyltransferase involved in cell wall biosynthesis